MISDELVRLHLQPRIAFNAWPDDGSTDPPLVAEAEDPEAPDRSLIFDVYDHRVLFPIRTVPSPASLSPARVRS